jgi:hypothetical protein
MSSRDAPIPEAGRTYRAPNGIVFTQADKFRDYMVANFYSFRKRSNEKLVKYPGDLAGQPFEISQLESCTVLILDVTSQVNITGIRNSRVFITPCAGAVFISNAVNCLFSIASSQLRVSYSEDCVINAHVQNPPSIEMSRDITFGNFNGLHSLIKQQYRAALLDERIDRTLEVVDFSITAVEDLGPLPHWKKIDCANWSVELNEDEAQANLSAAARLAVANLLDRFDADGDGAMDYAELNAYQAATGDSDRVADAVEMKHMFEAANIPLDPSGKLRYWSLVQLYAMQGKDALIRDIVAVGARDILPGKLPSWVVKVPPGFSSTTTTAPQISSASEMSYSVDHAVGKAVTPVQVNMRLPMPAIPPTPPRLPPLPSGESKRALSSARSKSSEDSQVAVITPRKPLCETFTVRLLERALKEVPSHTATCFDRHKDATSSTVSLDDFIRCCTALHVVVGGVDRALPSQRTEGIVEESIMKELSVLQQHKCASVEEDVRVQFQRLLLAARPKKDIRPSTPASPHPDPDSHRSPKPEERVQRIHNSRPPRPQTPAVPPSVPTGKALSPQDKLPPTSPRFATDTLEQSLSRALNRGALERIGKMLHDGSGPFVSGVRRGSTSSSVPAATREHDVYGNTETAAASVASGTVGRLLTAKRSDASALSAKDQKRAKDVQRLRLLNRGDVEGLCEMLLDDLKTLVSASSDRFVRLLRGVASSSGQTVEQTTGSDHSCVDEVIVVSTVTRLLESVDIRYPLPVVALVLLKIGGFLLVAPELQSVLSQSSPSGAAPVDEGQLKSLCDYSRAMIGKKVFECYLQGVRAEVLSAKALPASTWNSKKEVEAQAESARCLKLFRSALANAVRGIPPDSVRSWLNETQVRSFVSQFEIVPDVWIECEARANATAYLASSAGKAAISAVVAADGCSTAEANEKVKEQHTLNLIDAYSSSAQHSEKLFWAYVKDVRAKRWPASFSHESLPSSSGCETYPEGFESWLQWREAHRRLKEAKLKDWERTKRSQLIAQQVAKGSMAPIAAIERAVKSLARRAQVAHSEGSAVTFAGMDATNSHGPVKAMHPSRAGMLVEARLARLREKAVSPPRDVVHALATVSGMVPSEEDDNHTDDERRSIGTPSVVGSLPSTNRLSATVPGPAGKVVSLFDFQQEFGGVLFSLQADPVVGPQAKRLADPSGLARAKIEQLLREETEEGDSMRARFHAWEEEHATRVGLQQGLELNAQQLQERALASLIQELVAEEAVSTSMQFSPSQQDVIAVAVASEFDRRRKAQLHFAAWVLKKEEQRRAAAVRSSRQLNAKAIEKQQRRARSASAYSSWLSSTKQRKQQNVLPTTYAHDGLYTDLTAGTVLSPSISVASPESKSPRVDAAVSSPAGGASLNSSHFDIHGAKRLNFSVSDVSFQSVARRVEGNHLSNVQRFHGPIATQSSPRVDLGDGSFRRSPVSAVKGKVPEARAARSLPANQRTARAVPPRGPPRKPVSGSSSKKIAPAAKRVGS